MKHNLKTIINLILAMALPLPISTASVSAQDLTALNGTWESISCEVRPQVGQDGKISEWWLTRKIEMKEGKIAAEFTTYAGPGCGFALQRLDFGGSVTMRGTSSVAQGAIEADLLIDDYVRFTPMADGFADFLNSAPDGTCGAQSWQVGTTQDVLEGGCSVLGLKPNDPTQEFEVLAVVNDQLYFGARPVDGTFITSEDKRPKALLVPLAKIK